MDTQAKKEFIARKIAEFNESPTVDDPAGSEDATASLEELSGDYQGDEEDNIASEDEPEPLRFGELIQLKCH